eukprot:Rmarinus@m.25903
MRFGLIGILSIAACNAVPLTMDNVLTPEDVDVYGTALKIDHDEVMRSLEVFLDARGAVTEPKTSLPVLQMHGMGDFATNSGMMSLKELIEESLDTYVLNLQIGETWFEDSMNSFFMNFDDQVDYAAEVIRSDPALADGFNAIGYSQGVHVIRGYIERYNDPPVRSFISMHGPIAGVAALPYCDLDKDVCRKINELLSLGAYNNFVQERLAQANYYKDPAEIAKYLEFGLYLADVQNERSNDFDSLYAERFSSLQSMVAVKADADKMVVPIESQWFGAYSDGSYDDLLTMTETPYYQDNLFGLKTLHEDGRIHFYETEGDHLRFETDFLLYLLDEYFAE